MIRFFGSRFSFWNSLPLLFAILTTVILIAEDDTKNSEEAKRRKAAGLTDVEEEFVKAINNARKKRDLPGLKTNLALVAACREHAGEMAKRGAVADAFDGKQPGDRIQGVGVKPNHWGITNGKGKAKAVVNGWVADPIADANILEPHVNQLSIGIATDDAGETYVAVVYVEVGK